MGKSLKDNYIEFSKNHGGTHALISKGIKKGIVNSIMRGSIPKANELYEVAKVLGVTVEELLTGDNPDVVLLQDKDEKEYVEKLLRIFREKQDKTIVAIKQNIEAFLDNPDKEKDIKKNIKHSGQ
ncbi:MAG: hypothetical protein IT393_07110 [Nitrospirae bacterium]|nr:hypothetical protein [Nitrospirota bacterium]